MPSIKPRLIVADPSLVDSRGHHFALTQLITRGAKSQGIEVLWFTHLDFAVPDAIEGVKIFPVFSATMYDRYRPEKKHKLLPNPELRLLDELNRGISLAGLGENDHVFFHTSYGDLYMAVPGYVSSGDWRLKPFLHLCTPYDLDTMPGRDPGEALPDVFRSMRTVEAVDRKLFFWAETPQLASHYTMTFGFNVRGLPLPPPEDLDVEHPATNPEVVTALYLGAAREEKGFLLLPELVERLYETYGLTGKLRFVIQCTPQIIGYLPSIKEAIEKLTHYPDSYVQLIDNVLNEREYREFLKQADVVLLLYDRKNYRIRGSGIAVEAICANKSILTYHGTFCESLLTDGGGWAVGDMDEATIKLSELVENKNTYRQNAKLQGRRYRAINSPEKYVLRVIEQTTPAQTAPFFPAAIVGHVNPPLLKI